MNVGMLWHVKRCEPCESIKDREIRQRREKYENPGNDWYFAARRERIIILLLQIQQEKIA